MPLTLISSSLLVGFLDYFAYGLWKSSLAKGGKTNHGLDNVGYIGDDPNNQHLIIPTIEIQPATPLSSEPNTPVVKPKEQKTPLPPSPLVATEAETSLDSNISKTSGKDLDHVIYPLGAAAVAASLVKGDDDDKDKGKDTDSEDGNDKIEKKDEKNLGDAEKEEEKLRGSGSPGKVSVVNEVQDSGADKPLPPAIIASPQLPVETSTPIDPTDYRKSEEDTKGEDKKTDDVKSDDQKPDTKAEDKKNEDDNKDKHFKPPPLDLSAAILLNSSDGDSGIPKAVYSSPELSSPPSPPPSSPATSHPTSSPRPPPILARSMSEINLHNSVPTTPVGRRHPVKKLRRMSSFDDIPPSSPDSPFAKRVASFVVIPVKEPGVESTESSSPAAPSTKDSSPSQEDLSKAVNDLNKQKKDEKIMFTVGSADSLDSISSDPLDGIELLSPRRGVSREPDMLDPIRERGESKLYVNDTDKIEIHPSPEDASRSDATDSPDKTDAQGQDGNK